MSGPAPKSDFPPIRACLFDMDGLLLDSEDKYTICTNTVLQKYGRPPLPWSIKAQLQGRPGPAASKILHEWAQLPVSQEVFYAETKDLQKIHFPDSKPLPGVEKLLGDLATAKVKGEKAGKVHIALATSSHEANFKLKTSHLEELFTVFSSDRRVLGDDQRIAEGRGKPSPDIYLLALQTINSSLEPGEEEIRPEECLVFEDSVPGVEAGRRAGMRVIWCPHPELRKEYTGKEEEVLAGRTGSGGEVDMHLVGEIKDGWGEHLDSLMDFPYAKYGILVQG
ncbi:HAD-like protein [Mollisia scopiformis]|uniref:HAD-like protein n=1 Tax=Mollisia scopiformis TaxID=149040 RepID=A0A194X8Y9_MOLSC|nr:HAD-like protein [Mollisia scopiformis]KUJ16252.1 HAD-like protein [Mollisia scopiformis]